MVTLDSTLEDITQLDFDSRKILQKRQIEARRDEIAKNAKESLADYRSGKLQAMSAEKVIERLNNL